MGFPFAGCDFLIKEDTPKHKSYNSSILAESLKWCVNLHSLPSILAEGLKTWRISLTFEGTTTTLNTNLTEVDKLEVGANNTNVGAAITQSGTGDILNLYDGSTEVFSVQDGGRIVATATNSVIPFLYSNLAALPSASTYHGAFAHVHAAGKAFYAHANAWYELVYGFWHLSNHKKNHPSIFVPVDQTLSWAITFLIYFNWKL